MIDLTKVVPVASMQGDDEEDTRLLDGMYREAYDYISSQAWVVRVRNSYFGLGVGGVVAVFLIEVEPSDEDIDEYHWIIVGDLPPAYIATYDAPNPASALDAYIGAMQEWVDAAKEGQPVDDLIPVNVEPTKENAEMLSQRLEFIDSQILPDYKADLE